VHIGSTADGDFEIIFSEEGDELPTPEQALETKE